MNHFQQHTHTKEQAPQTEGNVLHSARSYDFLTGWLLKSSEESIRIQSQIQPGNKVLDAGCGSGRLTLAAQKWVGPQGEVVGLDASPEMIQVARQKATRAGLTAKFEVGVVEAMPFPDGSFDVVLNRLMLHHLPGDLKQRGLAEMRRVLKPGGICLVVDFESPKSGFLHIVVQNHMAAMVDIDVRNYVPLLEQAGFVEVITGKTSSKLLSYVRGRVAEAAA
jgi:ubiquinone/menaquinone biosynthesis C-methylase UbiE